MSLAAIIPAIAEDGSYYKIEKLAAHEQGVLHRAISVFIFDGEKVLLQKRAADKYHCPGLWANACCTHPHWEESTESAARRRLYEEMRIHLDLSRCNTIDYRANVGRNLEEHERVTLFRGSMSSSKPLPEPNPEEVARSRWAALPELRCEAAAEPERFAPWLRIYLNRWDELGLGQ